MMTSPTSEATILPKAPPITTPTARSITLPFIANSLNSEVKPMGPPPRADASVVGGLFLPCALLRCLGGLFLRLALRLRFGRGLAAGLGLRRRLRLGFLRRSGAAAGLLRFARRLLARRRRRRLHELHQCHGSCVPGARQHAEDPRVAARSEEHTSELQSPMYPVC